MSNSGEDYEQSIYCTKTVQLASIAFWSLLYFALTKIFPTKNLEYSCRVVALIHGTISAFLGINQCFIIDWPFDHPEWRTTSSQRFIMVLSMGYFVYDLTWCLVYQRDVKLMLAHHAYSVFALYRMLPKTHSGAQTTCALGSMEITNPFLQTRWLLRSEGFYPSAIYTAVEITFIFIFFLVRILLGSYFMVVIVKQPRNDWEFKVLSSFIYIMSWMFMINIVKYFINKYGLFKSDSDNDNIKRTE